MFVVDSFLFEIRNRLPYSILIAFGGCVCSEYTYVVELFTGGEELLGC